MNKNILLLLSYIYSMVILFYFCHFEAVPIHYYYKQMETVSGTFFQITFFVVKQTCSINGLSVDTHQHESQCQQRVMCLKQAQGHQIYQRGPVEFL